MAKSNESKAADAIVKMFDVMQIDYHWIMVCLMHKGTATHQRLFDFCVAALSHYGARYDNGEIGEGRTLYNVCRQSSQMIKAIDLDRRDEPWS